MVVPDTLDGFRDHVRAFIDREVAPNAERWTRERTVPRTLHAAAGAAGLLGLKYPIAWGGTSRPYAFTQVHARRVRSVRRMGCLLSLALQSEFATPAPRALRW